MTDDRTRGSRRHTLGGEVGAAPASAVVHTSSLSGGGASGIRKEHYDTGDWYYGQFKGGVRHGKGLYVYAAGPVREFEGDFKNGLGDGLGVFRFSDGGQYNGEVREGDMHGHGKWVMADGGVYTGSLERGQMHGHGVYTRDSQGLVYEGDWAWGKKSGVGTLTVTDKDTGATETYCGNWKNNLMHGEGEYRHSNGDVYVGRMERGKRCGFGSMQYSQMPGERRSASYVGFWRGGKYHGRGTFTHADGVKVEDLMWADGNRRANVHENLWWDDQCFVCNSRSSPMLDVQMMCCEMCPNVAHMDCINSKRQEHGQPPFKSAPQDFFCGQVAAATGKVCEESSFMEHMKALEAAHRPDPATPEPDAVSKQTQNDASPLPADPIAPTSQNASPLPTNLKPCPPGKVDTPSKECASATRTTCGNRTQQVLDSNADADPTDEEVSEEDNSAGEAHPSRVAEWLETANHADATSDGHKGVAMSGNPTRCQAQLQVQEAPLPLVSLETQANIKKSCTLSQGAHRESPAVLATSFARYPEAGGTKVETTGPWGVHQTMDPNPAPASSTEQSTAVETHARHTDTAIPNTSTPASTGLAMDIPRSPPRSSSAPGVVDVLKKDGLSTLDECLQDEPKESGQQPRRAWITDSAEHAPTHSPATVVTSLPPEINSSERCDPLALPPQPQVASGREAVHELRKACEGAAEYIVQLEADNARLRSRLEDCSTQRSSTLPTMVVTSFSMLHHQTPSECPERKERIILLHQDICSNPWGYAYGGGGLIWDCNPKPATRDDLLLVHDEDYLRFLMWKAETSKFRAGGMSSLSDAGSDAAVHETAICCHSVEAVLSAAGCVLRGIEAVANGEARNVFCLVRPPGHHAASSESLRVKRAPLNPSGIGAGFCLVNNVLVGAKFAKDTHRWRVAVVDFDAHHGNGSEQVIRYGKLKDDNGLMLCSIHQYNRDEFPGTGGRDNMERNAEDGGAPWIINVPIPYTIPKEDRESDDMDSYHWRRKVVQSLLPHINAFKPDLILMSAGFDAHKDDPIGHLKLVEEDFYWITKALVSTQAVGSTVPHVVSVLEGGYGVTEDTNYSLSRSACAHIQALSELGTQGSNSKELDFDIERALTLEGVSGRCGLTRTRARRRDTSTDSLATSAGDGTSKRPKHGLPQHVDVP